MRKIYCFLFIISALFLSAQNIEFTDIVFKNTLVQIQPSDHKARDLNGNWCAVDTNNDGQIQQSEAVQIGYLILSNNGINNFTGINYFTELSFLDVSRNNIQEITVSGFQNLNTLRFCPNVNLTNVEIHNNPQLTTLNLTNNTNPNNLTYIDCSGNNIDEITVDSYSAPNLNSLVHFDISNNNMDYFQFSFAYLPNLEYLDLRNNAFDDLTINSPSINEIYFTENPLVNLKIQNIAVENFVIPTISTLQYLRILGLQNNYMEFNTLQIAPQPNLVYLDLAGFSIPNGDLIVEELNNIQILNIEVPNTTVIIQNMTITEIILYFSYAKNLIIRDLPNLLELVDWHVSTTNNYDNSQTPETVTLTNLPSLTKLQLYQPMYQLNMQGLNSLEELHFDYFNLEEIEDGLLQPLNIDITDELFPNLIKISAEYEINGGTINIRNNHVEEIYLGLAFNHTNILHADALNKLVFSGRNLNQNENGDVFLRDLSNLQELRLSLYNDYGNTINNAYFHNLPGLNKFYCYLPITLNNGNNISQNINVIELKNTPLLQHFDLALGNSGHLNELKLKDENIDYTYFNVDGDVDFLCIDNQTEYNNIEAFPLGNQFLNIIQDYYFDCPFYLSGNYNKIYGTTKLDDENDGCSSDDINTLGLKIKIQDGNEIHYTFPTFNGDFVNYLSSLGNNITLTPIPESDYFDVSPTSATTNFTTLGNEEEINFCLTPLALYNDLEVVVFPNTDAIPGFSSTYTLLFKNKGTSTLSGELLFYFNEDFLHYVSSSIPTSTINSNNLTWQFSDLQPFEQREIEIIFTLNTPTDPNYPLNANDILTFSAEITSSETDETPTDNNFVLNQIVVNSFDPNDKIALEGHLIQQENIGGFLTYRIRFENTGTYLATNIIIKDEIDISKLDLSSFQFLTSSHNCRVNIENNTVEFIFENINLPFDDENNDGYVVFKIKTINTLEIGDTILNDADIYFDYNFPISTNTFDVTISNLNIDDIEDQEEVVFLYPNPVMDNFNIESELHIQKIEIYDIMGRILSSQSNSNNQYNVSQLVKGTYFVKIFLDGKTIFKKFIK